MSGSISPHTEALLSVLHALVNAVCMAGIIALLVPVAVVVYRLMMGRN